MKALACAITGVLFGIAPPAWAATGGEAAWRYQLDLRDLPANTRPAEVRMNVDASVAERTGARPLITLAVNGIVIARRRASATGTTIVTAHLEDRLLSTRNTIEVAAVAPECSGWRCPVALATVHPLARPRFRLEPVQAAPTDFSQLITRYRNGIALRATTAEERGLAELARQAIAPRAPVSAGAGAVVHVGAKPPRGAKPLLRFDLGPVRLVRSDGAEIASDAALRGQTVVQMLRGGPRPLVWVRPGDAGSTPGELRLDEGDIALFSAEGRSLAFSTRRDRAVRIAYGTGVDASGAERTMLLWRAGLLAAWLIATIFLAIVFRRLPRPQVSGAAA